MLSAFHFKRILLSYQHQTMSLFIVIPTLSVGALLAYLIWSSVSCISSVQSIWPGVEVKLFERLWLGYLTTFAKIWHGYEIHGAEKITNQNCLLVGYHARVSVDCVYLTAALQCRPLIFHRIFDLPFTGQLVKYLGAIPSKLMEHDGAEDAFVNALCRGNKPLLVVPGGAYECLKPLAAALKVNWKTEPGFARCICAHPVELGVNTTVVPFYTKNCEQCAFITAWWYDLSGKWSRYLLDQMKKGHIWVAPAALVICYSSLGFPFLPRPVKLDTYFAEPLVLQSGESAASFADRVRASLQSLIDSVEAMPERPFPNGRPTLFTYLTYGLAATLMNAIMTCVAALSYLVFMFPLQLLMGLGAMTRHCLRKKIE